ncbi:hypothetical protein F6B42_14195 [Microbacterium radiodurans]|uniref:Uncharacterized protein n=1 Tax=Microbacterium radiodurans TaxID=661398 RepID=A0A5J5IR10_9MICO|nr:hypothetical protein F6B42_14195 [Microbacterium radiodurans]
MCVRRRVPWVGVFPEIGHGCVLSPGARCQVPGAGCRVPGAGCRVPGAGCRVPGAGGVEVRRGVWCGSQEKGRARGAAGAMGRGLS